MPRGDARGPEGRGPLTGRGLGPCAGHERPGFAVRGSGGVGRGRGRGWRNVYRATGIPGWQRGFAPPRLSGEEREDALKDYAKTLREEAEAIERRIRELKADDGEEV